VKDVAVLACHEGEEGSNRLALIFQTRLIEGGKAADRFHFLALFHHCWRVFARPAKSAIFEEKYEREI